jgi:hypothetical protein
MELFNISLSQCPTRNPHQRIQWNSLSRKLCCAQLISAATLYLKGRYLIINVILMFLKGYFHPAAISFTYINGENKRKTGDANINL